jgi:hypothetical protein
MLESAQRLRLQLQAHHGKSHQVNAKHFRRLPTASRSYAAFGFQAIFSLFLLAAQSRKYMLINVW